VDEVPGEDRAGQDKEEGRQVGSCFKVELDL
jgi:hypothetical protein